MGWQNFPVDAVRLIACKFIACSDHTAVWCSIYFTCDGLLGVRRDEADRFNHSRTCPLGQRRQPALGCGNNGWLSAISKERLQRFRAAPRQHPAPNLNLMIQSRVIQHLHH